MRFFPEHMTSELLEAEIARGYVIGGWILCGSIGLGVIVWFAGEGPVAALGFPVIGVIIWILGLWDASKRRTEFINWQIAHQKSTQGEQGHRNAAH